MPSPSTTPHGVRDAAHGEVPEALLPHEPGTQHFALDDDSVPELGGSRPDRFFEVRPQERVLRHTVEQTGDVAPGLPALDAPVPQTVDSVGEVLKIFDKLVPVIKGIPGLPPLVNWLLFISSGAWVLILLTLLIVGLLLTIGMLLMLPWRFLSTLTSGLMGAGKTSLLCVGLKLLVLACTSLLLNLLLRTWFGVRLKSVVMLVWSVAVLFCLSLGLCRRFSVLNFGVLILPCRRTGLVIWVLTTLMLLGVLVACLIMVA